MALAKMAGALVARCPGVELAFEQPRACLGWRQCVVDCWLEEAGFALDGEDGAAVGGVDMAAVGEAEAVAFVYGEDGGGRRWC
jgi:hypothetical protein